MTHKYLLVNEWFCIEIEYAHTEIDQNENGFANHSHCPSKGQEGLLVTFNVSIFSIPLPIHTTIYPPPACPTACELVSSLYNITLIFKNKIRIVKRLSF